MTIIEQLESWFQCEDETQVDGDGIFNGDCVIKEKFHPSVNVGEEYSSYFYDPYNGTLMLYDAEDNSKKLHEFQCNLVIK